MVTPGSLDAQAYLKEYLSKNFILIVDNVSSARVSLAATLAKLGALRQNMALVGSIEEAREVIAKERPKIIFSDFMIGNDSGLNLIQDQKIEYQAEGLSDTVFVLITANSSQSTVARAAEEDVDTFIIKPYTINSLRNSLAQAVDTKINPSRYLILIAQGKESLFKGDFDTAKSIFLEAKMLNAQPTLACFYLGQTEMMKSALATAGEFFEEGLGFNKIHYKCLVGLFELLNAQKKYSEAYDVVKKLAQYFPANPQRLASVLRLAIFTQNFQDIEAYYRIYLKTDSRSDELVKYMCSALVVTGKYYLRNKIRARALQVFENAAVSAGSRMSFLLYTVDALVDAKMKEDSERFLKRMENMAPASHEYKASKFIISTLSHSLIDSIQMGREAITEGIKYPSLYEKLICQSMKAGYLEAAETLYDEAIKKWPEKFDMFECARSTLSLAA